MKHYGKGQSNHIGFLPAGREGGEIPTTPTIVVNVARDYRVNCSSLLPPAGWTHSPLHRLDLETLGAVRKIYPAGAAAVTREYGLSSFFHVAQVPASTSTDAFILSWVAMHGI